MSLSSDNEYHVNSSVSACLGPKHVNNRLYKNIATVRCNFIIFAESDLNEKLYAFAFKGI